MKIHGEHVTPDLLPVEYTIDVNVLDASTMNERKRIIGSAEFVITVREWDQFVKMMAAAGINESDLRHAVDEQMSEFASVITR